MSRCFLLVLFCLVNSVVSLNLLYANLALDLEYLHRNLTVSAGSLGGVGWGPMKAARSDVMLFTAVYDTWALNDKSAKPTVATKLSRTSFKSSELEIAIAHASYRVLTSVFGNLNTAVQAIIDSRYESMGVTISDSSDLSTPAGVGNNVGELVIADRANDGSNWDGSRKTSSGAKYSDYTNYRPSVGAFGKLYYTDCSALNNDDLSHWQPATVLASNGSLVTQLWGDVQFTNVKTWGITSPAEVRPRAPPLPNNKRRKLFLEQIDLMLAEFAQLDDRRKVLAQNWVSGPEKTNPTSHLTRIAWDSARILGLNLEKTTKLLFVHAHSQLDTMIAQFENKRYYDPPRPTTPIQCIDSNKVINTWLGPYLGVGQTTRSKWRAYLPPSVVQNGTPEYPCGHCSISGATAEILRLYYKGNDTYVGEDEVWEEGSLPLEPKITDPTNPNYVAGLTDVPNSGPSTQGYAPASKVVISYSTWTEVAEVSSNARMLLGVHWKDSATQARRMGEQISRRVWAKAQKYFDGEQYCERS